MHVRIAEDSAIASQSRCLEAEMSHQKLPVLYIIDRADGRVGLTTESDEDAIYRRLGTDNVRGFRPATEDEVGWIRAMGGHVPKGRIAGKRVAA